MIEFVIALAIAAIILLGVFMLVQRASRVQATKQAVADTIFMMEKVRASFAPQGSFRNLSTQTVIDLGLAPPGSVDSRGYLRNQWKAAIDVRGLLDGTVAKYGFLVPAYSCVDFVVGIIGTKNRIRVGYVYVKNISTGINTVVMIDLAKACNNVRSDNFVVVEVFYDW